MRSEGEALGDGADDLLVVLRAVVESQQLSKGQQRYRDARGAMESVRRNFFKTWQEQLGAVDFLLPLDTVAAGATAAPAGADESYVGRMAPQLYGAQAQARRFTNFVDLLPATDAPAVRCVDGRADLSYGRLRRLVAAGKLRARQAGAAAVAKQQR